MAEFKKRKVLFVYPDFVENRTGTQLKGSYSEGIASISAVLKQGGHDTALYHLSGMVPKEEYIAHVKSVNPDFVAFSTWTSAYPFVKDLLKWTKEDTDLYTVCGGYHATLCPEEVIADKNVDAVCIGEGEYPILDLCNAFDNPEERHKITSFWFNVNGEVIKNPVRPFISDLDALPMPDMELFDFDRFLSSKIKTAIVMVSRGCIFSCTYCANSQLRKVYPSSSHYARFKSAERAVSYLEHIIEKYPYIEYFNFMDSILNMKKDWFEEFIDLYKERLAIPFCCRLRLDIINEDIVRKLKEANCYLVDVGIECGDADVRKNYLYRNMSDETILESFALFNKYKISTLTFNIVGLPYETIKTSLKTVKLNARIKPNRMVISIFYPFPNTKLTDMAREAGFIDENTDFSSEVPCKQPQYPAPQVLFAQHFFKHYVSCYKIAYKLPGFIGKAYEKWLDFCFTFPYKPHMFFVYSHKLWNKLINTMKRVLMKISPKMYLKLRDSLIKLKKVDAKEKKNAAAASQR